MRVFPHRRLRPDGYVDLWRPDHPLARKDGYVFEHRAVAWDAGLLTERSQIVHHKNGDRSDNRLVNLVPLRLSDHSLLHAEERGTVRNQHGEWKIKPLGERESQIQRWPERKCLQCHQRFRRRSDAIYCSDTCRIKAWKRRKESGL